MRTLAMNWAVATGLWPRDGKTAPPAAFDLRLMPLVAVLQREGEKTLPFLALPPRGKLTSSPAPSVPSPPPSAPAPPSSC